MKSKILSIIIPVYNVENYIRTALESVFKQDVPIDDYEVIIVNDGTRDNSMLIVNEFCQKYNNIKIVNQKNQGLSVARNSGLTAAIGDYIWFVDSDDTIIENCLSFIFEKVKANPETDVFISRLVIVNEKTGLEKYEVFGPKVNSFSTGPEYLSNKRAPYGAVQRFIFKRSFLIKKQLTFLPGVYHEDAEFGPKMLYQASLVYIMDQTIYKYLHRANGSIMSSWRRKNSEDVILVYRELVKFRDGVVLKKDLKTFNHLIYRILSLTMEYAIKSTDKVAFNEFYVANKSFLKKEASKYIEFSVYDLPFTFNAVCCFISPLFGCKLQKKFRTTRRFFSKKRIVKE